LSAVPGLLMVDEILDTLSRACVATGGNRLYANVLLTIGFLPPSVTG
jgi:hypothetical protein